MSLGSLCSRATWMISLEPCCHWVTMISPVGERRRRGTVTLRKATEEILANACSEPSRPAYLRKVVRGACALFLLTQFSAPRTHEHITPCNQQTSGCLSRATHLVPLFSVHLWRWSDMNVVQKFVVFHVATGCIFGGVRTSVFHVNGFSRRRVALWTSVVSHEHLYRWENQRVHTWRCFPEWLPHDAGTRSNSLSSWLA